MWLAVGEELKQRPGLQVNVYCRDIWFFRSMYNKQLLDSVFVISRIIKVRLITLTSYLDYSGYQKPHPTIVYNLQTCRRKIEGESSSLSTVVGVGGGGKREGGRGKEGRRA